MKRKLFHINISNPLKTWWKARKYFKRPKINFYVYTYFKRKISHYPYASNIWLGKILDICSHDIFWKDKYDSPRHERSPIIFICLFSTIAIWITFSNKYVNELGDEQCEDIHYWEFLLWHLYYDKDLLKALRCSGGWTQDSKIWRYTKEYGDAEDGTEDKISPMRIVTPTQLFSLNKRGFEELKRLIKEEDKKIKLCYI